jgi:pilus assembly protein CpaC
MRALPFCVLLALSITAYGQQPGPAPRGPAPGETQPDTSGLRLQQLLHNASQLQRAGQPEQAAAVLQQAEWERQGLLNRINALQAEIERMRTIVGHRQQVLVHLQIMEVSLTKLESLGFDVTKLQGNAVGGPGDAKQANAGGAFSVIDDGSDTHGILAALRKDKLAKLLAEPTLVTISGQEATFRSGGQLAIPTPQKDGSSAAEYQFYGTEVQLKPDVLADRSVRLAIHCRVSELDHANSTRVGKDTVPGIRSRDIAADAEIKSGRTLVLCGLVQSRVEAVNSGLPWLGEIPYAGAVFRRVKETRNQIATFVLITPEILEASAAPGHVNHAAPPTAAVRPTNVDVRR